MGKVRLYIFLAFLVASIVAFFVTMDQKDTLIFAASVLLVFLIYEIRNKVRSTDDHIPDDWENTSRPKDAKKPTQFVENDKLVTVKGVSLNVVKTILEQFCNMYNQEAYSFLPRLTVLDDCFVVTFPYDVSFTNFCWFVNYVYYPCLDLEEQIPDVKAWATGEQGVWGQNDWVGKRVMLYIPDGDEEHDKAYLTTEYNVSYKLGFGTKPTAKKLDKIAVAFEICPVLSADLEGKESFDFE